MDVRTAFLNGDLSKDVYVAQPPGFEVTRKKNIVCKLQKFIHALKEASRQWYLKFDQIVNSYGFKENVVDQCIYMKVNGSSIIFLVLHVNNILLACNDIDLLTETKRFLFGHYEMKDPREVLYILSVQILHDKANGVLRLLQKTCIDHVLKRFKFSRG